MGSQGALALVFAVLLGLGIPSTGRAEGTACPNEALRLHQGSTALPDCRAWEMVSPPDKNGGDIALQDVQVSSDGESLTYASCMSFAAGQSVPVMSQYLSARGPDGWSVQPRSVRRRRAARPRRCAGCRQRWRTSVSPKRLVTSPTYFQKLSIDFNVIP